MSAAVPSSCTIPTGPPYLQLVPMCTIFFVKGLHHRKRIATGVGTLLPCVAYITYVQMCAIVRDEHGCAVASLWHRHVPSCGLAIGPRHNNDGQFK